MRLDVNLEVSPGSTARGNERPDIGERAVASTNPPAGDLPSPDLHSIADVLAADSEARRMAREEVASKAARTAVA